MLKTKPVNQFSAVVDDIKAGPFSDLQNRLDALQDNGMTALTIRSILFHKMLDLHSVPAEHFLREQATPQRLDDPALIEKLNALGFYRKQRCVMH
ncbi:hypothetical protein J8L98_09485 [Pseudoalteromonas sp. MMG013]|uniref:Uncharacterized protein n=1 Tax=Pseudoalteromonas aurantia 208 TaxID=1314867 RepID=A0ABR9E8Z1_9GAMM|nr:MULTISPECIES: hypothetical protein [Pseudoalteromonas]MBE0367451.1 hypothetical protein [Pseudoalteromonas aurantia 208]MBQ4846389.1 hypothetical protein [Pseudoalteromonas sp. MMG005]MBQ4849076.1 hypothetical protein [Pseudoalteromonas sp. MMG012]MBQ4861919.1 hypothetical protein [Pseudoalteromonas sp. MMG013]